MQNGLAEHNYFSYATLMPDAALEFKDASQITDSNSKDIEHLNKELVTLLRSISKGIIFGPLNLDSLTLDIFVDAGSAANPYHTPQLVLIIMLIDIGGNLNIFYYGNLNCKCETCSALTFKLFVTINGSYILRTMRHTISAVLSYIVLLHVNLNSLSLVHRLVRTY